jgi:hypothetical protein
MKPGTFQRKLIFLLIPTMTAWSVACKTFHTKDDIRECATDRILVATKGGNEYVFDEWVLTSRGEIIGHGKWHKGGYPNEEKTVSFTRRILPPDSIVTVKAYEHDLPRTIWLLVGLGIVAFLIFGVSWKFGGGKSCGGSYEIGFF